MTSLLTSLVRRSVAIAAPMAQAYAEGNMDVGVKITRVTARVFNRDTGQMSDGAPITVYEGLGRMYTDSGGQTYNLGEEQQFYSSSYVSIPVSAPRPQINDDVQITSHRDPELVGRHYRITGVDAGGLMPAAHRCAITGAEPAPNVTM